MRYARVLDQQYSMDQHIIESTTDRELLDSEANLPIPIQHLNVAAPQTDLGDPNEGSTHFSRNIAPLRVSRAFPVFTFIFALTTGIVFIVHRNDSCSQPLMAWSFVYVTRHVAKTILYHIASRHIQESGSIPSQLIWSITLVDMAGPTIWVLGGYYIFHTDSCSTGLYTYAVILWSLQTISLLLPCCFLSGILLCAPCLLWLAPYVIRPNPNTMATNQELLSKIPKIPFSALSATASSSSCSICLGEYSEDDEIMKLPCSHFFHSACITEWACLSQLCPICRTNITSDTTSGDAVDAV